MLNKGEKRLHALTFLVFLIPGSPKDILTYAIGLTKMRFADCLLITGVARIPSIVTSTMGGAALGTRQYVLAGVVLAVTLLLSGAGLLVYRRMGRKKAEEGQAEDK